MYVIDMYRILIVHVKWDRSQKNIKKKTVKDCAK